MVLAAFFAPKKMRLSMFWIEVHDIKCIANKEISWSEYFSQ